MPFLIIGVMSLVTLLGGGGTIIASQNSLPGDMLFPMKLALEDTQAAIMMDDDKRNELRFGFAENRLAEINSVLEKTSRSGGKIEDSRKAGLDQAINNLNSNLAQVRNSARELRLEGSNDKAFELNEDLKATAGVLGLALDNQRSLFDDSEVRNKLDDAVNKSEDLRRQAEVEVRRIRENERREMASGPNNSQSSSGKINAAENKVNEVERRLESFEDKARSESIQEARGELSKALGLIQAARDDSSLGRFNDAFEKSNEAIRVASLANALVKADSRLGSSMGDPGRVLENMRREDRQIDQGFKIEARIVPGATDARAEVIFMTDSTDKNEIARELVDKLKSGGGNISDLIEIKDNQREDLQTKNDIRANVRDDGSEVRAQLRFPLTTTDPNGIVRGISDKLTALNVNDVANLIEVRSDGGNSISGSSLDDRGGDRRDDRGNEIRGRDFQVEFPGDLPRQEDRQQDRSFFSNFLPSNFMPSIPVPVPFFGDVRQEDRQNDRQLEFGDDRLFEFNPVIPVNPVVPFQPDIRQEDRQNEIRGRDFQIEFPGDQPRQEDRLFQFNPAPIQGGGVVSPFINDDRGNDGGMFSTPTDRRRGADKPED